MNLILVNCYKTWKYRRKPKRAGKMRVSGMIWVSVELFSFVLLCCLADICDFLWKTMIKSITPIEIYKNVVVFMVCLG